MSPLETPSPFSANIYIEARNAMWMGDYDFYLAQPDQTRPD